MESPALTDKSKHYPERFGGRVPKLIKMKRTVLPDPLCVMVNKDYRGMELRGGETYEAWTNRNGAVSGICANGKHLGVKPDEFEVVEWF
jgi:hypothetical protein